MRRLVLGVVTVLSIMITQYQPAFAKVSQTSMGDFIFSHFNCAGGCVGTWDPETGGFNIQTPDGSWWSVDADGNIYGAP